MEQLENTGFEEGMPSDWHIYTTGTKHICTYSETGRSGGFSMAIEYPTREIGKVATFIQSLQIDITKTYKLSGWMMTEAIDGKGASIKVEWRDVAGEDLGTSRIMTYQVGTIPWTNFEGDVTPNPGATEATIVLSLSDCSGKVWFDDISLMDVSPTETLIYYPNIYLNASEIDAIKVKKNVSPWKIQYDNLVKEANISLGVPPQSVTLGGKMPPSGNKHDYYSEMPSGADRYDYLAAAKLGNAVRSLGLTYSLTGNMKYVNKAVEFINVWCIRSDTKMTPKFTDFNDQGYIELCVTMPSMFYGASLIWNNVDWSKSDKAAFKQWVQLFIYSARTWTRGNNFENWRLVFIGSASVITGDIVNLKYAFDKWKVLMRNQVDYSGRIVTEIGRSNSLSYSTYALNGMIQTAEIAKHNGVDLYNYKLPDGRCLEKVLDFYAPYVVNPSTWPYPQVIPYDGANAALYELAYAFKRKAAYKNVINKWKRPMYEKRVMGPVTLTHGVVLV